VDEARVRAVFGAIEMVKAYDIEMVKAYDIYTVSDGFIRIPRVSTKRLRP